MFWRKLGYLLVGCLSLVCFSCGDDDEDESDVDLNLEDPRVRAVTISKVNSASIVVNDVENLIFNYDSLTYGTDVTKLKTYFYGYTSSPSIYYRYNQENEWSAFTNGSELDFSKSLWILAVSQDGANQKEYRFDLRVHKFDVSAFSWQKSGTISLENCVVSQKSITLNGTYAWFCRTSKGNACYTSQDGSTWKTNSLDDGNFKWETLTLFNDSLWVQDETGVLYVSPSSSFAFEVKNTDLSVDRLLFEMDGKLWVLSENNVYCLEKNGTAFEKKNELPSDFSMDHLTTFTAVSGFTRLGYLYTTQEEAGSIWAIDYRGSLYQLVEPDGTLPYLENPMVYIYDNTLGIVGGKKKDGTQSSVCYASYDCGESWTEDWHKNFTTDLKGLNHAGVFVYSSYGELLLVGGNIDDKPSTSVWKGVLNQLIADDLNYK